MFESFPDFYLMSKKPVRQNLQKSVSQTGSGNSLIYGFLIALSLAFIIICLNNKFIQDDAYISFRYVQNFVDGNGLVFNIGEKVEGYTNLLWVLILSMFAFAKINIESVSQYLSILFGTVVLIITYFISENIKLNKDITGIKKGKTGNDAGSKILQPDERPDGHRFLHFSNRLERYWLCRE